MSPHADEHLQEPRRAAARPPSRAVGGAGVLARFQPGERRPCTRVRSVRGTAMSSTPDVDILTRRAAPLDMDAAAFRTAGHALVDRIADWLNGMPHGPVTRH